MRPTRALPSVGSFPREARTVESLCMQLSHVSSAPAAQSTGPAPLAGAPMPPPPPGPGFTEAVEALYSKTNLSRVQSERMARFALANGYGVDRFIAAKEDAYKISSVDQTAAWKYAALSAITGAATDKLRTNYDMAYALSPISSVEAIKLAAYAVIRGSDTSVMKPVYDAAYAVSDISSQVAADLARIAVEGAITSPAVVIDSFQWYRSQPGGREGSNAIDWTREHLAPGFIRTADDMLARLDADMKQILVG